MNSPTQLGASALPPELGPLQAGDPALIGPYRVAGRLGQGSMGAVFGAPGWMNPERYDGVAPTPAADVFVRGTMVAFAATGRNPFGSAGTAELARRARQDAAERPPPARPPGRERSAPEP